MLAGQYATIWTKIHKISIKISYSTIVVSRNVVLNWKSTENAANNYNKLNWNIKLTQEKNNRKKKTKRKLIKEWKGNLLKAKSLLSRTKLFVSIDDINDNERNVKVFSSLLDFVCPKVCLSIYVPQMVWLLLLASVYPIVVFLYTKARAFVCERSRLCVWKRTYVCISVCECVCVWEPVCLWEKTNISLKCPHILS